MTTSSCVKRWQIPLPSLNSVDGHSVAGVGASSYYDGVLVRDGAGTAEKNTVKI